MRRSQFRSTDPADLQEIMDRCEVGQLGIVAADGIPIPVPVNFVWHEGRVVFHGAAAGEKYRVMAEGARVSFSAALHYSLLAPSLLADASACGTTQFYKSALVRGRGEVLADPLQALAGLESLMRKYVPEGGYEPLSLASDQWGRLLRGTAVFAIQPLQVDVKVYMGQSMTPERRAAVIAALQRRGADLDLDTAREIARYAPPV